VRRGKALGAALAAILVVLALAPVAAVRAEGVDGGSFHLKLSDAVARALKRDGVRLTRLGPAKAGAAGVTLPIAKGLLDSASGSGYLLFDGGVRLRAGKRGLSLRRLVLDTDKRSLSGKVGGASMPIAKLPPQQASIDGFNLDLALKSLKLTGRAATAFNRRLGLDGTFEAGRPLGSATATAEFETLAIRGGEIALTLDPAFAQKLASVEVEAGPVWPATLFSAAPLTISAPLEPGQIAPDGSDGVLIGLGGLALRQPGEGGEEPIDHTISLIRTVVDLEKHLVEGAGNYQPNPQQLPFGRWIASFPSSIAVNADPASGEISATSVPLALHPDVVPLLDELFGAPKGKPDLFAAGEIVGTLGFRARTR
jgi:hypothetical protein